MTLKKEDCSLNHEAEVYMFRNKNTSYCRLASCPKSKIRIINNGCRTFFNLESVSLKCNVTSNSHNQYDVHTVLEVVINTTAAWKPFDRADLIVICTRNDSERIRHITTYNVVYDSARGNY